MTRDLEYYRLQPYSRTFEIRTEGSERYLLYRIKEIPHPDCLVSLEPAPVASAREVGADSGIDADAPRTVGPATRRLTAAAA